MKHRGLRSVARNTAFLTVAQAINVGTCPVYVIVVARIPGPEIYALLAYSQSWYMAFLPIAMFGMGRVIIRSIGTDRSAALAEWRQLAA